MKRINLNLIPSFLRKLEKLFKARSRVHLVLIFFIFGISGSISLFLSDYVLEQLNSGLLNLNLFYLLILRLLVLIILYQFILLIVSFFFGEFNYFSKYSLKLLSLIKRVK